MFTFLLLLFILSIFSCPRCFASRLTIIWVLPSSVRNTGVDIKTLHVSKLSFIKANNFKRLSRTVLDGELSASFVRTCKMALLGFFWIIGIKCYKSANVAPGKLRTLTGLSFFDYAINDRISNYDSCSI